MDCFREIVKPDRSQTDSHGWPVLCLLPTDKAKQPNSPQCSHPRRSMLSSLEGTTMNVIHGPIPASAPTHSGKNVP